MKLPRGDEAAVDERKISDYILSLDHAAGRNKARVFKSALGMTTADAGVLIAALRQAARSGDAEETGRDRHGARCRIDFDLEFGRRRARVRSAWLVPLHDAAAPSFLTCYVL